MEQIRFKELIDAASPRRRVSIFYQKRYICAMVLFSIVLAYSTIHILAIKGLSRKVQYLCYTPECTRVAAHIQTFVNKSADACDDFYKFACGNFHQNFRQNRINRIEAQQVDFNTSLYKLVLDKEIDGSNEWTLTKNVNAPRTFFSTCVNGRGYSEEDTEANDVAFLNAVDYITGGWPREVQELEPKSWWDLMLKSREMGMQFDFFLDVNITKFPHAYLQIGPPELGKFTYYNKIWETPKTIFIQNLAFYWGYDESYLLWEYDDTLQFANQLRDLVESSYLNNSGTRIPKVVTKISNLQKSRDSDPEWLPFLTNLTGIKDLNENDLVYFKMENNPNDNYISKLNELIESTPIRHWLNYINIYHVLRDYQFLSHHYQIFVTNLGFPALIDYQHRVEFCLHETGRYFRKDVERVVNHLVTTDEKQHISTMYDYIYKVLAERLRIEFADNESLREGSIDRLRKITLYIGASEHFFEDDLINEAFTNKSEELGDNAIEMIHSMEKKRMDHLFSLIRKPRGYYNRVLEIGDKAYTYSLDDYLYLLTPILREPTYSLHRPEYVNYGSLGVIIAHELLHMLDHRLWDKNDDATLTEWEEDMKKHRKNSMACAKNSYVNYYKERFNSTSKDIPVYDMEEVLSDFGAADVAYQAYLAFEADYGPQPAIAIENATPFTPYQIFWIMSSTSFCDNPKMEESEPEWKDSRYEEGRSHPLPSYRVNGPKMNCLNFLADFSCKNYTKMNPIKKCTLFP